MNKKLVAAIRAANESRAKFSCNSEYTSRKKKKCRPVVMAAEPDGSTKELLPLLNELPKLYSAVKRLSNVARIQVETIVQLQSQVQFLLRALDVLALGRIQAEVGKQLYEHIAKLAETSNMYVHEGGRVTLNVDSSFCEEVNRSALDSQSGHDVSESISTVKTKLSDAWEILAGISLGAEHSSHLSSGIEKLGSVNESKRTAFTQTGTAIYEHQRIMCDPSLKIIQALLQTSGSPPATDLVDAIKKNPFAGAIAPPPAKQTLSESVGCDQS